MRLPVDQELLPLLDPVLLAADLDHGVHEPRNGTSRSVNPGSSPAGRALRSACRRGRLGPAAAGAGSAARLRSGRRRSRLGRRLDRRRRSLRPAPLPSCGGRLARGRVRLRGARLAGAGFAADAASPLDPPGLRPRLERPHPASYRRSSAAVGRQNGCVRDRPDDRGGAWERRRLRRRRPLSRCPRRPRSLVASESVVAALRLGLARCECAWALAPPRRHRRPPPASAASATSVSASALAAFEREVFGLAAALDLAGRAPPATGALLELEPLTDLAVELGQLAARPAPTGRSIAFGVTSSRVAYAIVRVTRSMLAPCAPGRRIRSRRR